MAGRKVDLRTAGGLWEKVAEHLADHGKEQAGALLVRARPEHHPSVVVAVRWQPVPEEEITSREHGLEWDARFNLRVADEAEASGLGVVLVHKHGGPWPPKLSRIDRERGASLLRFLRRRCPSAVHGLLVVAATGIAGWLESSEGDRLQWREIRIGSPSVEVIPHRRRQAVLEEKDRQLLAFGHIGMRAIETSTIGVVGLSGGGSHVAQQLIHAGVGELVGIDPQIVDKSNLRRLVGAYHRDIGRSKKVDVFRRLARNVRPEVRFTSVPEAFPSSRSLHELRRVDVLVGCVDDWGVRNDLNQFALEYRIPYIDIGATISPPRDADGVCVSGQIAVILPGGPCLRCMGLVTDERVGAAQLFRQGYLAGEAEPQVVSINGVLASEAVTATLMLVAGGPALEPLRRYRYPPGMLREVAVGNAPDCRACRSSGLRD